MRTKTNPALPAAFKQDASFTSMSEPKNQTVGVPVFKLLYSTAEASALLSMSPKTLFRLRDRGLLKPSAATRHLLWPHSELVRFVETTSL